MAEFKCCVPGCKSRCELSSLDDDRAPAALRERAWFPILDAAGKVKEIYCLAHEAQFKEAVHATPVSEAHRAAPK